MNVVNWSHEKTRQSGIQLISFTWAEWARKLANLRLTICNQPVGPGVFTILTHVLSILKVTYGLFSVCTRTPEGEMAPKNGLSRLKNERTNERVCQNSIVRGEKSEHWRFLGEVERERKREKRRWKEGEEQELSLLLLFALQRLWKTARERGRASDGETKFDSWSIWSFQAARWGGQWVGILDTSTPLPKCLQGECGDMCVCVFELLSFERYSCFPWLGNICFFSFYFSYFAVSATRTIFLTFLKFKSDPKTSSKFSREKMSQLKLL